MPENTKDVQTAGEQEGQGPPIPDISGGSKDESSAGSGLDAGALADKIAGLEKKLSKLDMLDDIVDARVKSVKDRRVDSILGKIDNLDKVLDYFQKFDGDKDKVARELAIDELLEGRQVPSEDQGRSPATDQQGVTESAVEILKKYQIPFDDPEVKALSFKQYNSLKEYANDLENLGRSRSKTAKQDGIGNAAVSLETSVAPIGDSAEELTDQLAAEMGKTVVNWNRIDEIKNKLDQVSPPEEI